MSRILVLKQIVQMYPHCLPGVGKKNVIKHKAGTRCDLPSPHEVFKSLGSSLSYTF